MDYQKVLKGQIYLHKCSGTPVKALESPLTQSWLFRTQLLNDEVIEHYNQKTILVVSGELAPYLNMEEFTKYCGRE
jgi:hypothetical protein